MFAFRAAHLFRVGGGFAFVTALVGYTFSSDEIKNYANEHWTSCGPITHVVRVLYKYIIAVCCSGDAIPGPNL